MTAILDSPTRQRHSVYELLTLDPVELEDLIARDFNALVSLAIADATHRKVPEHVRRALRADGAWEDWQDALACAEATLQVAVERLDYECDERADRVERQLRAVRCQFHIAANKANKRRRHANRQAGGKCPEWRQPTAGIARDWLRRVYRTEYAARVEATYDTARHGEPIRTPDTRRGLFELAIAERWITPTDTEQALRLLDASDDVFQRAVIEDSRDQNDRIDGLFHPYVTERWHGALTVLMRNVAPAAHSSSEHVLGPLATDLPELDQDDAYRILNARRHFAHLRQRLIECNRWARIWTSDVLLAREADPRVVAYRDAQRQARLALAEAHPEDFARILAALAAHGPFGPEVGEHSYPPIRNRMLAELFPGWTAKPEMGEDQ